MSAKLDFSEHTIVIWCDRCSEFGEMAYELGEAHDVAVKHEQRQHPELHAAEENRAYYRRKLKSNQLVA